jgi:hypothetical protein
VFEKSLERDVLRSQLAWPTGGGQDLSGNLRHIDTDSGDGERARDVLYLVLTLLRRRCDCCSSAAGVCADDPPPRSTPCAARELDARPRQPDYF